MIYPSCFTLISLFQFPDDNGVQMVNLDSDQEVGRWLTLLKRVEPGNDKEPHPANIAVILQGNVGTLN